MLSISFQSENILSTSMDSISRLMSMYCANELGGDIFIQMQNTPQQSRKGLTGGERDDATKVFVQIRTTCFLKMEMKLFLAMGKG